jgi:hypothetical protein
MCPVEGTPIQWRMIHTLPVAWMIGDGPAGATSHIPRLRASAHTVRRAAEMGAIHYNVGYISDRLRTLWRRRGCSPPPRTPSGRSWIRRHTRRSHAASWGHPASPAISSFHDQHIVFIRWYILIIHKS